MFALNPYLTAPLTPKVNKINLWSVARYAVSWNRVSAAISIQNTSHRSNLMYLVKCQWIIMWLASRLALSKKSLFHSDLSEEDLPDIERDPMYHLSVSDEHRPGFMYLRPSSGDDISNKALQRSVNMEVVFMQSTNRLIQDSSIINLYFYNSLQITVIEQSV